MNQAGRRDFSGTGNWSRGDVLNIEGRPSRLPDNSREHTVVLDGGNRWKLPDSNTAALYPFAVLKSKCPLRIWCGNLLCSEFSSICIQLVKSLHTTRIIPKNTETGLSVITAPCTLNEIISSAKLIHSLHTVHRHTEVVVATSVLA